MPLSPETITVLEQLKSNGTPCRFVMLTRASKVTSLVAYRKGSPEAKVTAAKKAGTGTPCCGVADGQGTSLSFKLLASDGWAAAPIKNSVLKDYLAENASLKVTPTIDIVEVLPPVADDNAQAPQATPPPQATPAPTSVTFRSGVEWKTALAAITATNDPQARAKAIADAVRDYGAEHLKLQKHLAANPQWPRAKETQDTLNTVQNILKQLQAAKAATPQPTPVVPLLQPRQPTPPASATAAPQTPTRPQATTSPPQPAAAAPQAAAAPPRPTRPTAATPSYDSAASKVGSEISGQLQSQFGAKDCQAMLAECEADAKSDFGKIVAALPTEGMPYEKAVTAYRYARILAEKYIKDHGKPLIGKNSDKVEKAKVHCQTIIATIDKQLANIFEQDATAREMAEMYQGFVKRKRAVPPAAANEMQRLASQPLISRSAKDQLNKTCASIYDSNWVHLGPAGDAIEKRALHAADVLSMHAKTSGRPEDQTNADHAKEIRSAITRRDALLKNNRVRDAVNLTEEAIRQAKAMDANVTQALANASPDLQRWQALDVRGRSTQLLQTDDLDGAANPAINQAFRKALKEMEGGNHQAAIATAEQVNADFVAAHAKYEAARQACAAYGDLSTLAKKSNETARGISVALQASDPEMSKRAMTFSNGAFSAALQHVKDEQFIQGEKAIQNVLEQLKEIKQAWAKQRGQAVKQEFGQRTGNASGAAEKEIAARIGEQTYLEMLDLAESIAKSNKYDLSKMNKDEIAAVFGYTTEDFNKINPLLRDMKPDKLNDQQWAKLKVDFAQYTQSLIEGMKKMDGFTGTVVRGTTLPDSLLNKIKTEKKFSDKAFLSTSSKKGFNAPHQILIEAKGKNGKDVSNFSMFKDSEQEILFLPGTEFRLIEITEFPPPQPSPLLPKVGELLIKLEEI